jgi:hypothetical protein
MPPGILTLVLKPLAAFKGRNLLFFHAKLPIRFVTRWRLSLRLGQENKKLQTGNSNWIIKVFVHFIIG